MDHIKAVPIPPELGQGSRCSTDTFDSDLLAMGVDLLLTVAGEGRNST